MDVNEGGSSELLRNSDATNGAGDDVTSLWHLLHPSATAPVTLQLVPGAGRGLVASTDLEPGEVPHPQHGWRGALSLPFVRE